jgi:hypothetical protein
MRLEKIHQSKRFLSIGLAKEIGRHRKRFVQGRFAVMPHVHYPFVWILVTDSGGDFLRTAVRPFLRFVHPRLASPVFRTSQIQSMVESMNSSSGVLKVRIRQVGGRSRINSDGAQHRFESDRKWTDRTISEVFENALMSGQWITDVTADFTTGEAGAGTVKIGRYGALMFRGRGVSVYSSLLDQGAKIAQERYAFLRARDRNSSTTFVPRPFEIDFEFDALQTSEQVLNLYTALRKIPRTTCTVLHGNPYFHAVLTDFTDGSVYEVLVVDSSKMTVIPQARASARSLQRLGSYVFANFNEGDFKEIPHD